MSYDEYDDDDDGRMGSDDVGTSDGGRFSSLTVAVPASGPAVNEDFFTPRDHFSPRPSARGSTGGRFFENPDELAAAHQRHGGRPLVGDAGSTSSMQPPQRRESIDRGSEGDDGFDQGLPTDGTTSPCWRVALV